MVNGGHMVGQHVLPRHVSTPTLVQVTQALQHSTDTDTQRERDTALGNETKEGQEGCRVDGWVEEKGMGCTCVVVVWTCRVSACRVRLSCHSFMSWGLSSSLPLPSLFRMKRRGGVGALMTALARTPSLSPTPHTHSPSQQIYTNIHYLTISAHARDVCPFSPTKAALCVLVPASSVVTGPCSGRVKVFCSLSTWRSTPSLRSTT